MSRPALADHPKFLQWSGRARDSPGTEEHWNRRSARCRSRRHQEPRNTEPADLRCRLSRSRSRDFLFRRIEGVASSYSYALNWMSPTVAPIVNLALSSVRKACRIFLLAFTALSRDT